jgi:hypothetical protein
MGENGNERPRHSLRDRIQHSPISRTREFDESDSSTIDRHDEGFRRQQVRHEDGVARKRTKPQAATARFGSEKAAQSNLLNAQARANNDQRLCGKIKCDYAAVVELGRTSDANHTR